MHIVDTASKIKKNINLGSELIQFIDIKRQDYFSLSNLLQISADRENDQLQLQTFGLKPSLAPQRIAQQSNRKPNSNLDKYCQQGPDCQYTCGDLAKQQCAALVGGNTGTTSAAFLGCRYRTQKTLRKTGTCYDSPLYLYGQEMSNVFIYSATPLYPSNTDYSPATGLKVTLNGDGSFTSDKERVFSFKFDYETAIKIEKPTKGIRCLKRKKFKI